MRIFLLYMYIFLYFHYLFSFHVVVKIFKFLQPVMPNNNITVTFLLFIGKMFCLFNLYNYLFGSVKYLSCQSAMLYMYFI